MITSISDARRALRLLEADITALLQTFEMMTGTTIEDVELRRKDTSDAMDFSTSDPRITVTVEL